MSELGAHFLDNTIVDEVREMPGPYIGFQVLLDKKIPAVVIGPTPNPIIKPGGKFVRLPREYHVMGRKQGHPPNEVHDLGQYVKQAWWISVHTIDPHHILIDWDGVTTLNLNTGQFETAQVEALLKYVEKMDPEKTETMRDVLRRLQARVGS